MARKVKKKRINSKLITILLVMAVPVVALLAIALDSKRPFLPRAVHKLLGRDPEVLLENGKAALDDLEHYYNELKAQADAIEDPKAASEKWDELYKDQYVIEGKKVGQKLTDARRFGKGDLDIQIKVQNEMVRLHKISGNYMKGVVSSWEEIVKYDTNNIDARSSLGKFYLETTELYRNSESLQKLNQQADVLMELEPEKSLGKSLKLLAVSYELISGLTDNRIADEETAESLKYDLEQNFPQDILAVKATAVYGQYLVNQAATMEMKNDILAKSAKALKGAIDANPESNEAYKNYFDFYITPSRNVITDEIKGETAPARLNELKQQLANFDQAAISEYNLAVLKFPNDPELLVDKANYMLAGANIDFAEQIELYEKAVAMNPDDLIWRSVLGKLYYISYNGDESDKTLLIKAREQLREAYYKYNESMLLAPEGRKVNYIRYSEVMPFLALTDLMLVDDVDGAKAEINDIYVELAEDKGQKSAIAIVCDGLNAIAEGQEQKAVQRLYTAVDAEGTNELSSLFIGEIRWKLFELLKDGQYKMTAIQNASQALRVRHRSGADYCEVISSYLKINTAQAKNEIVLMVDALSKNYENDQETYNSLMIDKALALVSLGKIDQAREVIADITGDSVLAEMLRVRIIDDTKERVKLLGDLFTKYPDSSDLVSFYYNDLMSLFKEDPSAYKAKVLSVLKKAIEADPSNATYILEEAKHNEPDYYNISDERLFELRVESSNKLPDEFEKEMSLGRLYSGKVEKPAAASEADKTDLPYLADAVSHFEKAAAAKSESPEPLTASMAMYLQVGDFDKAQLVADKLKSVDEFAATFAEIDLLFAQEKYEEAESKLSSYLAEYPLSANGHLVLSKIYYKLGRKADALAELEKSLSQNRFNVNAVVDYISKLHEGYVEIGLEKLGPEKIKTMMTWIEHLSSISPGNAVAVTYQIQYSPYWAAALDNQLDSPNIDTAARESYQQAISRIEAMLVSNINALLAKYGTDTNFVLCAESLAKMSMLKTVADKREAYYDTIDEIYQKGMTQLPGNPLLASRYELFLRSTGRSGGGGLEKLKEMLGNSEGQEHFNTVMALANFYNTDGDLASAVALLNDEITKTDDLDHRKAMRGMLAMMYKNNNEYEKALEVYSQQRKEQDSDEVMTLQIEAMMDAGFTDKALPLLEQMEKEYPEDYKVYLLKAKYALRETKYDQAIELADKAMTLSEGSKVALQIKSQAQFYADRLYEAMQTILQLRAGEPEDSNVGRAMLAQINARMRKYDDAILELRKGLAAEPGNIQMHNYMVNILQSRKRWNELVAYYQKRITIFPNNYRLYSDCATAMIQWANEYRQQGKNELADQKLDDALEMLNQAILAVSEQGGSTNILIDARMKVLMTAGRYDEILLDLDKNAEITATNPQLMLRKMEALYGSGAKDKAMAVMGAILDKFSNSIYLEIQVEEMVRIIDPKEVIDWVDQNIGSAGNKAAYYLLKSLACRNTGDFSCSVDSAKAALADVGTNPPLEFVITSKLAIAYIQNEQYEDAIVVYRKLCQQAPDNYSLLNNLAYALLSAGGHEKEALDTASKAYSIARLDAMVLDTYGMALLQNDKAEQAGQIFSKAIQEMQRNDREVPVEFEFHLAQAMVKSGRSEEAAEMMEELLRRAKMSRSQADLKMVDDIEKLLGEIKK